MIVRLGNVKVALLLLRPLLEFAVVGTVERVGERVAGEQVAGGLVGLIILLLLLLNRAALTALTALTTIDGRRTDAFVRCKRVRSVEDAEEPWLVTRGENAVGLRLRLLSDLGDTLLLLRDSGGEKGAGEHCKGGLVPASVNSLIGARIGKCRCLGVGVRCRSRPG